MRRAAEPAADEAPGEDMRIPRPLPDGIEYLESLGRWIDNLMGDARIRRRVQRELEPLYLEDEEMPDDPPPSEPPPPLPDEPERIIKERKPSEEEQRGEEREV